MTIETETEIEKERDMETERERERESVSNIDRERADREEIISCIQLCYKI